MEDFSYIKSPKNGGLIGLIISISLGIVNFIFLINSNFVWWLFIPLLPIAACLIVSFQLYRSEEKWEIFVTENHFKWNSPSGFGIGKSFDLKLNEIQSIVAKHSNEDCSYFVKTIDGTKILLSQNCGVNLSKLFACLKKKGIEIENT